MRRTSRRARMIMTTVGTITSLLAWAVQVYRIYTEPVTAEERLQKAVTDLYGDNISYFVVHEDGEATIPQASTYTEVED